MYLFVWINGDARQFKENLAVYDVAAAKEGLLKIYRFDAKDGFSRLVFDLGPPERLCWVPVPVGKTVTSMGVRIHSA